MPEKRKSKRTADPKPADSHRVKRSPSKKQAGLQAQELITSTPEIIKIEDLLGDYSEQTGALFG